MLNVFISYAREDRRIVEPLAHALEAAGWTVFWDFAIPAGKTWRDVVLTKLTEAGCVLVVWSPASITSRWVLDEAEHGLERHVLIPVRFEDIEPPFGFRSVQTADLTGWTGSVVDPAFQALLSAIARVVGVTLPENAAPPEADPIAVVHAPRTAWKRAALGTAVAVGLMLVVSLIWFGGDASPSRGEESNQTVTGADSQVGEAGKGPSTVIDDSSSLPRAHFVNVGQAASTLLEFADAAVLVDAGTGNGERERLLTYLETFFKGRPDLKNRLSAVIISHPHTDHVNTLMDVVRRYVVALLVDNGGPAQGSGGVQLKAARAYFGEPGRQYLGLDANKTARGYSLDVTTSGSTVRLYGGFRNCENQNNDSLVVRVDAGGSSLLMPADAEAVDDDRCRGLLPHLLVQNLLQPADILQVPHHGSTAGLHASFLQRVSARVAVISAGRVDVPPSAFDAFNYGHPRASTITALEGAVSEDRPRRRVFVMNAAKTPVLTEVTKAVYCTCWDGHVVVTIGRGGAPPTVRTF